MPVGNIEIIKLDICESVNVASGTKLNVAITVCLGDIVNELATAVLGLTLIEKYCGAWTDTTNKVFDVIFVIVNDGIAIGVEKSPILYTRLKSLNAGETVYICFTFVAIFWTIAGGLIIYGNFDVTPEEFVTGGVVLVVAGGVGVDWGIDGVVVDVPGNDIAKIKNDWPFKKLQICPVVGFINCT